MHKTDSIAISSIFVQDRVLLPLVADEDDGKDKDDPVVVVHPNYFIEP